MQICVVANTGDCVTEGRKTLCSYTVQSWIFQSSNRRT